MATTSTIQDFEILQRILQIEDFRELRVQKNLDLQLEAQDALFSL